MKCTGPLGAPDCIIDWLFNFISNYPPNALLSAPTAPASQNRAPASPTSSQIKRSGLPNLLPEKALRPPQPPPRKSAPDGVPLHTYGTSLQQVICTHVVRILNPFYPTLPYTVLSYSLPRDLAATMASILLLSPSASRPHSGSLRCSASAALGARARVEAARMGAQTSTADRN